VHGAGHGRGVQLGGDWAREPSGQLCGLGTGKSVLRVGRQEATDGGAVGVCRARRVEAARVSVGQWESGGEGMLETDGGDVSSGELSWRG